MAGRLTAFQLQPGQAIKAGDPIGQVDSIGRWKLVADVDQYFLSRIRTGLSGRALINDRTVPITLIKHHGRRLGLTYLADQVYLNPHPKELMLRNQV